MLVLRLSPFVSGVFLFLSSSFHFSILNGSAIDIKLSVCLSVCLCLSHAHTRPHARPILPRTPPPTHILARMYYRALPSHPSMYSSTCTKSYVHSKYAVRSHFLVIDGRRTYVHKTVRSLLLLLLPPLRLCSFFDIHAAADCRLCLTIGAIRPRSRD